MISVLPHAFVLHLLRLKNRLSKNIPPMLIGKLLFLLSYLRLLLLPSQRALSVLYTEGELLSDVIHPLNLELGPCLMGLEVPCKAVLFLPRDLQRS